MNPYQETAKKIIEFVIASRVKLRRSLDDPLDKKDELALRLGIEKMLACFADEIREGAPL